MAALIPEAHRRTPLRQRLLAAMVGGVLGSATALIAWALSGALSWFWLIPVFGLLGWWALDSLRPNVLWGSSGR